MFDQRLKAFNLILAQKKLDGFIVTNPINIFYLTGFKGVSPNEREAILIFAKGLTLITAKLYQTEAKRLASRHLKIKIAAERNQIFGFINKLLANTPQVDSDSAKHTVGVRQELRVGFEEDNLKFAEYQELQKMLRSSGNTPGVSQAATRHTPGVKTKLVPIKNFVEDLRLIKTDDELEKIEKAQIISQKAFAQLLKTIKIGQTEAEIADRLTKIIKSLDGQGLAFESIVASGPNSARPHYLTGQRPITKGEVLLLDFGAKYQDYCADLTRTIFVGKVDTQKQKIWHLVAAAQKAAISSISHGIKTHQPHRKVHQIFKKEGLHGHFWHGLGHGIGLEVHERPHLKPSWPQPWLGTGRQAGVVSDGGSEKLVEDMVFSVEPGLYFPSWGGVRIEDLVVIKGGKAKVLGQLSEMTII